MCLFKQPSNPPPPQLPPAPPPPLPPVQPTPAPEPTIKDGNPNVRRAKDDRGKKSKGEFSKGTSSQRIKLIQPFFNHPNRPPSGGINK